MPDRERLYLDLVWATVLAAAGIGAAIFFFLGGDPCKSSARIEWLYVAPVLIGAASFAYVTRASSRWSLGLASSIAIALASAGVLFLIAIHQWGANCYR